MCFGYAVVFLCSFTVVHCYCGWLAAGINAAPVEMFHDLFNKAGILITHKCQSLNVDISCKTNRLHSHSFEK